MRNIILMAVVFFSALVGAAAAEVITFDETPYLRGQNTYEMLTTPYSAYGYVIEKASTGTPIFVGANSDFNWMKSDSNYLSLGSTNSVAIARLDDQLFSLSGLDIGLSSMPFSQYSVWVAGYNKYGNKIGEKFLPINEYKKFVHYDGMEIMANKFIIRGGNIDDISVAIAPEPVSSILFLAGGGLLIARKKLR